MQPARRTPDGQLLRLMVQNKFMNRQVFVLATISDTKDSKMATNPSMRQSKDFYEDIAKSTQNVKRNLSESAYYNRHRATEWHYIAEIVKTVCNPKILDIGCGPAFLLTELGQQSGYEYVGLDIARGALPQIEKTGHEDFILGNAQRLPFVSNSFDVVVASHLIEHLHDSESLLRECHRVLKDGGQLILATPNGPSLLKGRIFTKFAFVLGTAISFCLSILKPERFMSDLRDFFSARRTTRDVTAGHSQEEHVHEFNEGELRTALQAHRFETISVRFSGLHAFMYSLALNDTFGNMWFDITSILEESQSRNLRRFALDMTLRAEKN